MKHLRGLRFPALLLALAMAGCSTVTIRDKSTNQLAGEPTYESSKAFFLWGLVGEHHIDVKDICGGKGAKQIQAQDTFVDSLLAVITLGIYMPRTAKVWCAK